MAFDYHPHLRNRGHYGPKLGLNSVSGTIASAQGSKFPVKPFSKISTTVSSTSAVHIQLPLPTYEALGDMSVTTLHSNTLIDALTVAALALLAFGIAVSLTVGASPWGISFPIGAALLFAAYHLERSRKLK
jgi:CBS domain containing-hemolysin-like protein